jgi:transposase
MPILDKVKRDYDVGRIIVVADKGINTADNVSKSQEPMPIVEKMKMTYEKALKIYKS